MNTDNDTPCSAEDRAAIALAARKRRDFIAWISRSLASPQWHNMSSDGQDMIRAEARMVLEQMVEGCS